MQQVGLDEFFFGFNGDKFGFTNTLSGCITFSTLFVFLWPLAIQFWSLLIFGIAYGLLFGGFQSVFGSTLIQLFGTSDAATIAGIAYGGFTFGQLLGPPGAGILLDYMSNNTRGPEGEVVSVNFVPSIMISASTLLVGSLLALSIKITAGNGKFFVKV